VEAYDVDMWGTCVRVQPGERLRVEVMSGAFPLLTRNLNTGGDLGLETQPIVGHQPIFHEPGRLSSVTLPVVDQVREIETP
jgi:predicted acyl esterase